MTFSYRKIFCLYLAYICIISKPAAVWLLWCRTSSSFPWS